jgi:hypothetical protein
MPLEYRIDHERRVVFATAARAMTDKDFFAYQREVWSRRDLAGYDEIVDLSGAEHLLLSPGDRIRALAELASAMDVPGTSSRLAIVASQDVAYGFARMFETYRTLNQHGAKAVSVFRSMQTALDWLGVRTPRSPA